MKIVPKLKKGKKLLKGEEGTPVVISRSEYTMTPEGQFILLDLNGKWLFFDDMATRDSLAYQWYPYEDIAPASAFSNGVPNRKDPYYLKAQEQAKLQKKANKSEKKEKGGIMKGLDDLDTSNINLSGLDFDIIREKLNEKTNQRLRKIISSLPIDMPTRRDIMEMSKYLPENQRVDVANINRLLIYKASERKLLPRNIGKYGLFSRHRALLNNQSEIQPITSGEELIRNMPIGYNTAPKLKKGGIVKGQDNIKIIDTRENEDNDKYYSTNIREGETLSDVARIYGTSVNELMKLNPKIKDKNKIKAGEEILVPFKYSLIPQRTYKTFRNEDVPADYWNIPHAYECDVINTASIYNPYPYSPVVYLNEGEYEVDSEGNIKTYPMIVPKYYFNADAAVKAEDRYEAWKYGKEEQEFLRNNQLELVPHELLTYHDIPNTREGLLILNNINKIDKDMLLPGYSIHSYVNRGNYPVSVVRDNKGNKVFVLGNEDRLIPKTTLYIVRIGSDYSDPNYLLSLPGVSYKLR